MKEVNLRSIVRLGAFGAVAAGVMFLFYAIPFQLGFSLYTTLLVIGAGIVIATFFLYNVLPVKLEKSYEGLFYVIAYVGATIAIFGTIYMTMMSFIALDPNSAICTSGHLVLPPNEICATQGQILVFASVISMLTQIAAIACISACMGFAKYMLQLLCATVLFYILLGLFQLHLTILPPSSLMIVLGIVGILTAIALGAAYGEMDDKWVVFGK